MEHPVAIYCDFETVNRKLIGCEPDPKSSYTNMQTLQEASGFTYTVASPYFPNKVKTYRGEDAGEVFLRNILEEEKNVFKILKEIEMVNPNLSPEEEKRWAEEKKCHICKEVFVNCEKNLNDREQYHLDKMKDLLIANELDTANIPSMQKVKKQKRIISALLHRDKLNNASEDEKIIKEEKLKVFNVQNALLLEYLEDNSLFMEDEVDEEFDEEDELTEEEIGRILKKGWKVRDHDHWTGEYRGAAHSGCNLALRKICKIPVLFHNLSGKIFFSSIIQEDDNLHLFKDMMGILSCRTSQKWTVKNLK